MIVVDTSVWIDVFNETPAPRAAQCVALIEAGEAVALTDIILTEILQGFDSEKEARLVQRHLRAFPILRLEDVDDFVFAAELYRSARRAGVTIRKTLDCLIAAPCVRTRRPAPARRRRLRPPRELHRAQDLGCLRSRRRDGRLHQCPQQTPGASLVRGVT